MVCQSRSPSDQHGQSKCAGDESCEETKENRETKFPKPNCGLLCDSQSDQSLKTSFKKTPTKCTGDDVVTRKNERLMINSDAIIAHPSLYGFNAADWLDDSFTDEHCGTAAIKPVPCVVTDKDKNRSTGSGFKIYKDCDGSVQQNVLGQSLKNVNSEVLCDRTNVAHHSLHMSTKSSSPITKRTRESLNLCKETNKTTAFQHRKTYGTSVVDCNNSTVNNSKLLCRPHGHGVDIQVSDTCSVISTGSYTGIIALSSATVNGTRTELSSAITRVTASCQISSAMLPSLAVLTSTSVNFYSSVTSAVGRHTSVPNPITYASPVSSITICSTVMYPESAKWSAVSSNSASPQLCPSSIKTPQNQSSVRSSCGAEFSAPRTMVTPCNRPIQESTMKCSSVGSASPQLCPSSIKTPQNHSSVRSSCGAQFSSPRTMVTPCNRPIQESTMKCSSVSSASPQLCPSSIKMPQNQSSVRSFCGAQFSAPGTMVTPCNRPIQESTMKPTPPMCSCGCRAKRKFVQSPGQNMGRPFYCCGSSTKTSRKGCNFFKWENSVSVTAVAHSSEVTPLSTKHQLLSMQTAARNRNLATPLSNHTRQATAYHILVPPSFK